MTKQPNIGKRRVWPHNPIAGRIFALPQDVDLSQIDWEPITAVRSSAEPTKSNRTRIRARIRRAAAEKGNTNITEVTA